MEIKEILDQPEGRRFEFKEKIPAKSELVKTSIAFANDAGGNIFIGIKDSPRKIVGVDENNIMQLEEQVSNIIFAQCNPLILPEISILNIENKYILRVRIFRGNMPPYHLKNKGKREGTYIRVGSTNRQASLEIVEQLERIKYSKSFDSEIYFHKELKDIDINNFSIFFKEKTNEKLNNQILSKLNLFNKINDSDFPTYALILLSDDQVKADLFPYAKIECARFKGTKPGNFIDKKTIIANISQQPELAFQFILRHISEGTTGYEGVYRIDKWEYPVDALREVVRNAVVHRDYSLSGKDIKIAVFDDKIEITSPGKLMPSVDFNLMEAGQSEIRNKIIAGIFKKLGIIEQWGNGLKIISEDLKKYPEIEFEWSEPGIAFRVTFLKKNYREDTIPKASPKIPDFLQKQDDISRNELLNLLKKKLGESWEKVGRKLGDNQLKIILLLAEDNTATIEKLSNVIGISTTSIENNIAKLKKLNLIKRIGSARSGHWEVAK